MKYRMVWLVLVALLMVGCKPVKGSEKPDDKVDDSNTDIITKTKAITISGARWVDADFVQEGFLSSATGTYGDYATIQLTATSTGEATVDLTGATWSWRAVDTGAEISKESSTNGTAIYKGLKPGTIEVSVTATDGTTASYEVEVVESTFITFDLSAVAAEADNTYGLELPLVNNYPDAPEDIRYKDWEYMVDWGDGTATLETLISENYDREQNRYPKHAYAEAKEYTIRILNLNKDVGLQAWHFAYASADRVSYNHNWKSRPTNASQLTDVKRYGSGKMGAGMFALCDTVESFSATGSPRLGSDARHMFAQATKFNQEHIGNWDVSTVSNMEGMFSRAKSFNQDISLWNVSNVEDMSLMFLEASAYNNGLDPGVAGTLGWGDKTAQVKYMDQLFSAATSFNQVICGWNISSVERMRYMFYGASLYKNGGETFNAHISPIVDSSWNFSLGVAPNTTEMFGGSCAMPDNHKPLIPAGESWPWSPLE